MKKITVLVAFLLIAAMLSACVVRPGPAGVETTNDTAAGPSDTDPEAVDTAAEPLPETVTEPVTDPETVPAPIDTEPETLPETAEETESPAEETEAIPDTADVSESYPDTEAVTDPAPVTAPSETTAPETKAPETKAPETKAPETKAPETVPPETTPPAVKVTSLSIQTPAATLTIGKTMTLSVDVTPDNADDPTVIWSISSGSSCAKIDQNGVLTGVKAGKVTVNVKAKDGSGKTAAVNITVTAPSLFAGSGTKSDPYLIGTAEDLANLSTTLSTKNLYFRQTADVDLSGIAWTPIGTSGKPFQSHYDGSGFTISGLVLSDNDGCTGLFGFAKNASFTSVILENVSTDGTLGYDAGGLVGYAVHTALTGCRVSGELTGSSHLGLLVGRYEATAADDSIQNCTVSGLLSGGSGVGGLIGRVDADGGSLTVTGCSASVTVTGGEDVGGLIGYFHTGKVEACFATGNVSSSGGRCRGGLIGQFYESGEVSRCYATGSIVTTGTRYGDAFCGGLIGMVFSRCRIHDCYATGNIDCAGTWSDCQDRTSYNGGLWYYYRNPCGSLIGMLYAGSTSEKISVYNCYATGTVNVPNACDDERIDCRGSLIGLVYDTGTVKLIRDEYRAPSTTDIILSKNVDVTEDMIDGSMIERLENNYCVGSLRESYTPINYIVRNSRQTAYVGQYKSLPSYRVVTNIAEGALRTQSTFQGFDFSKVWVMGDTGPALRGLN